MSGKETEACGRCGLSSVVDTTEGGEGDPFAGDRIEVDDGEARAVSPAAWVGGVRQRLDDLATRLTYGR